MTEAQNKAVEMLRPEAGEFVREIMAEKYKTTKDNYGKVMAFLSTFEAKYRPYFLAAMIREGYPADTAKQVAQLV